MVLDHIYNGVWALAAARNYYRLLPGANPADAAGRLNQVLIRDLGAARLTLAVVLMVAAIWLDRRVLILALSAAAVSGVIRVANHAISRTPEGWNNWLGYVAAVLIPLALLFVVMRAFNRGTS